MKKMLALAAMTVVILACAGAEATTEPEETGTTAPAATTAVAEPTPAPAEQQTTFQPGETITITQDDEDWATVVVDEVEQAEGYGEYDKPQVDGNVFISALVKYEALKDGVEYNQFDWQVFVDGAAVDNFAIVLDGPEPTLSSGTLPAGRTASGYVVYEVPPEGEVLMSYSGNAFLDEPPVFEVVLRAQ